MSIIELLDAYYRDGIVHIIVQDIIKRCIKVIKCPIPERKVNECPWKMIDVDYITRNHLIKPNDNSTNNSGNPIKSDLLEFDF